MCVSSLAKSKQTVDLPGLGFAVAAPFVVAARYYANLHLELGLRTGTDRRTQTRTLDAASDSSSGRCEHDMEVVRCSALGYMC